jgi:hypothetical protein
VRVMVTIVASASSNLGRVLKGTRTYVDVENPRKGVDRGLSLPVAR